MKNKKSVIIGALLVAIVVMAVGYATLSQTLTITGTANIDAEWDVHITGITEGTLVNAETEGELNFDETTAEFTVTLKEPGASASYNVAIANTGSIDAVLASIEGVDEADAEDPTDIQFAVTGVAVDDTLAAETGTAVAVVTVTWNSTSDEVPADTSKTATIKLNYEQATE